MIAGSADPAFRGDRTRYNPEDLLVASLAACHMLWYLHLAADAGVVVVAGRLPHESLWASVRSLVYPTGIALAEAALAHFDVAPCSISLRASLKVTS